MFKKFLNNILGNDDKSKDDPEETMQNQPQGSSVNDDDFEDDDDEGDQPAHQYEFDSVTQHGTHYTKQAFDAAVEEEYQQLLANEKDALSEQDKSNIRREATRRIYDSWNGYNMDQFLKFEMANSLELTGYATSGFNQVQEEGNPLYEPIHGVSLYDYAALAHCMTQGIAEQDLLKAFGIEKAVWDEVNLLWPGRMKEDATFGIMTKYGEYFAIAGQHPKIVGLAPGIGAGGDNANLQKLKTDRYFYEELCGARTAAYEYGLDGAQWIVDNYGINLADFQAVAMDWMTAQNQNFSSADVLHYQNYQDEKREEYAKKFAAEQGGNVADDIEF